MSQPSASFASPSDTFERPSLPASAGQVGYNGRTAAAREGVHIAFPGVEVRVRFEGSSITLAGEVVGPDSWFNCWIDGSPRPRMHFAEGPFTWIIAEDLDPSVEHTLRLVRRNEAWQGTVRLDRFLLSEGGRFLPPPVARERKILCIGDSITCGDHIDFLPPYSAEGGHNTNAEATYAWQIAKHFDADVHLVSYGGKGVVRDWEGSRTEIRAEDFFERALPDDATSAWNHDAFHPQLVIIALGTNDFASGMLGAEEYVPAYVRLVERVHHVHPDAKVLLLTSPMLANYAPEKNSVLEAHLETVRDHFLEREETFVSTHRVSAADGSIWNAHPIAPQHQAMANELAPVVAKLTGWSARTKK